MTDRYSQEINQEINQEIDEQPEDTTHDSLVAFLKQNKPTAPPCHPNFEQQLFVKISNYPQRSPSKISRSWTWIIPAIVAAGLGLAWNFSRSQYQTASNPRSINSVGTVSNISESEQAAIEQSLVNSWSMNDDPTLTAANVSTDNQLLYELAPLEYE